MRTAISNSSRRSATRRPACRSAAPATICKAAIAGETHEYTDMYPGMARTAREEGFDEIADWFETLAKAEKSHAGRFQRALDYAGVSRNRPARFRDRQWGARQAALRASFADSDCRRRNGARSEDRMREGSLEAPTRHAIAWQDPDFTDRAKTEAEMRRVFDICHGCRRCFNLCDAFPRLFDLIDNSATGELDGVAAADYQQVADACTLCDMCFMTKCPYVPPHEFNVDFPHLMLRYRAVEHAEGQRAAGAQASSARPTATASSRGCVAPLANWGSDRHNRLTRPVLEKVADVDRNAALPKYHGRTFAMRAKRDAPAVDRQRPGVRAARRCSMRPASSTTTTRASARRRRAVLAQNGVETEIVYPQCCGMPQLEPGDLAKVAAAAQQVAATLGPWIDKGYDIVALVPSCALMLKFEWPLIVPDDPGRQETVRARPSMSAEYIVDIARKEGLAPGLAPLDGGVTLHIACHARAQNMGQKAAEMLRLAARQPRST